MNESKARELIERHARAYQISSIRLIPEGANHFVFELTLEDGTPLVAKFKKDPGRKDERRDSLYDGPLSLQRESALYRLIREKAALAAPTIYMQHESDDASFLLVEKLAGVPWREYLAERNFSRDCFLRSLEYLGGNIARLQRIKFPSFGDVVGKNTVLPGNVDNFAKRFIGVMNMRIDRASRRGVFTGQDIERFRRHFVSGFNELSDHLHTRSTQPVMVFTDLHADNFLVDATGRPSGYFDLESCQAAHPALEFYGLRLFLFNYFDEQSFRQAEDAFFAGFKKGGGSYDRFRRENIQLMHLLAAGRMLELTESYFKYEDGLRDSWSARFKSLFWQAIESGQVDYLAVGEIFREKTRQPAGPD